VKGQSNLEIASFPRNLLR